MPEGRSGRDSTPGINPPGFAAVEQDACITTFRLEARIIPGLEHLQAADGILIHHCGGETRSLPPENTRFILGERRELFTHLLVQLLELLLHFGELILLFLKQMLLAAVYALIELLIKIAGAECLAVHESAVTAPLEKQLELPCFILAAIPPIGDEDVEFFSFVLPHVVFPPQSAHDHLKNSVIIV